MRSNTIRLALLALLVASAAILAAAASAGQPLRETIHVDETFELENFCDVEGMTVEIHRLMDTRVKIGTRGDGFGYFMQHGTIREVLTFEGTSLTSFARVNEKDLRITDNGDGTVTVLILATGNAVLYGPSGKAIARNPGHTRFELVIDDGGTPTDPNDDEVLDFRVVKESTGRSDDFCDAAVPALKSGQGGS
jgi:hypothetical protein